MRYTIYAYVISRLTLFAFAMCLAGVGMLITGLLPQDKMDKVRAFMHKHFGQKNAKVNEQVPVRLQLIVFGAASLFIGLLVSGLIRL